MNTRMTVDFARVIVIYKIIEIRHQSLVNSNRFSFPWGVRVCGGSPVLLNIIGLITVHIL